jgi:hypothetical protein
MNDALYLYTQLPFLTITAKLTVGVTSPSLNTVRLANSRCLTSMYMRSHYMQ